MPDLSNKIANMVLGALDKGARNQVENDRTQAELLGILARTVRAQGQNVAQAHNQAVQAAQAAGGAPAPVEGLLPLVKEITAINEPDYRQRVARLREIADKMPGAAFVLGVSAADILARIQAPPPGDPSADGWLAALASVIALTPNPGDGDRLLQVAGLASWKFVKYRILLALYSLKARRYLDDNEAARAVTFIRGCLTVDDPSLQKKARATLDFFAKG